MARLVASLFLVWGVLALGCAQGSHLVWGPEAMLPLGEECSPARPILVEAEPGCWWVCSGTAGGPAAQRLLVDGSLGWAQPTASAGVAAGCSAVGVGEGLTVAWAGSAGVWAAPLASDGTWGMSTRLVASPALEVALGTSPVGYLVAWRQGTASLYCQPFSATLTPLSPLPLPLSTDLVAGPAFQPLQTDLAVAWIEGEGTSHRLWVARLASGRTWTRVLPANGNQPPPILAAGPQGSLWVAWVEVGQSSSSLNLMLLGPDLLPAWGGPWSVPAGAPAAMASSGDWVALAGTTPSGLLAWSTDTTGAPAWPEPVTVSTTAPDEATAAAGGDGWWFAWLSGGVLAARGCSPTGILFSGTAHELGSGLAPRLAPAPAGVVGVWLLPQGEEVAVAAARLTSDDTPPPIPQLTGPEGAYITAAAPAVLTWQAGADPETGTTGCHLRLGTTAGSANLRDMRVEAVGSLDLAGLGLPHGTTCHVTLTACNEVGLESEAAACGPYTVDLEPPTAEISVAANPLRGTVAVHAAGSDPTSPPAALVLALDGAAVAAATSSLDWSWDTASLQVAEGNHTLSLRASDQAGNEAVVAREVVVDNTTFDDVPKTASIWPYVEAIVREGITSGCHSTPPLYCPTRQVTRGQMAVFLCRAAGLSPLYPSVATFADVPVGHPQFGYIERVYQAGITSGCTTTPVRNYCPDAPVTRGQMAVFLCRAAGIAAINPATATFADVPTTHPQYRYIEALVAAGVTSGCSTSPRLYCPTSSVTRGQMAVFLCRAFEIAR